MLDLCSIEGDYLDVKFNIKNSNCIFIGPSRFTNLSTLYLSEMPLAWVEKIKSLRVYIVGEKVLRLIQVQ